MSCFWNRRTVARFKSTPGMMLFLSWTSCLPELMNLLHFGSIAILMLDCFVIGSQLSLQFSCWLRFRFLRALQELLRDSLFCLWPKSSPSFSCEVPCDCPRLSRWCCPCANGLAKKQRVFEVMSTNWADYLNLVYSVPFWEVWKAGQSATLCIWVQRIDREREKLLIFSASPYLYVSTYCIYI